MMRIGIIGMGYVGLSTAVVLADQGNEMVCVDVDMKKLEMLKRGKPPIYEKGMEEMLNRNLNRMTMTADYKDLADADILFICVPTPTKDGRCDTSYVKAAAKAINDANLKGIPVIKSTMPPTAIEDVSKVLGKMPVMNPEFLKEGTALEDTIRPDRVVIGADNIKDFEKLKEIWSFTNAPIIMASPAEASIIKYASNSFLATKVSFINEIADLCERIPNCDVGVIAKGMGMDRRIGDKFLNAGPGYGGSCFPKDTEELRNLARNIGRPMNIVDAAVSTNCRRPVEMVNKLKELMGSIRGKRIGVLGIAFKANTDDTRESVSIKIMEELVKEGAIVVAYDPKAKATIEGINQVNMKEECIRDSEGIIIATEWEEFRGLENALEGKYVLDTRRILNPELMDPRYFSTIGRGKETSKKAKTTY